MTRSSQTGSGVLILCAWKLKIFEQKECISFFDKMNRGTQKAELTDFGD